MAHATIPKNRLSWLSDHWLILNTIILSLILTLQPKVITEPQVVEVKPTEVIQTTLPSECLPYLDEIKKYDWDSEIASQIMLKESGCDKTAVNKIDNHGACLGSYGLFQISCTTSTTTIPSENIKLAYEEKYLKGGWKHWSTCLRINGKEPLVDCGLY